MVEGESFFLSFYAAPGISWSEDYIPYTSLILQNLLSFLYLEGIKLGIISHPLPWWLLFAVFCSIPVSGSYLDCDYNFSNQHSKHEGGSNFIWMLTDAS